MEKTEVITREAALLACKEISEDLESGVLSEIQAMKALLFETALDDDQLNAAWIMAGAFVDHLIQHTKDLSDDISGGRFLPREEAAA